MQILTKSDVGNQIGYGRSSQVLTASQVLTPGFSFDSIIDILTSKMNLCFIETFWLQSITLAKIGSSPSQIRASSFQYFPRKAIRKSQK